MPSEKKHDIFISYSRDDKVQVERIVNQLKREGLTVWWDEDMPPGESWLEFIKRNVDASRVMLVIWSKSSIESHFVKEEALAGLNNKILISVLIDEMDPPFGYATIQAIKLTSWKGKSNLEWNKLLDAIQDKVKKSRKKVKKIQKQSEKEWETAVQTNTSEGFYDFLGKNWRSPHASEALQKAGGLEKKTQAGIKNPSKLDLSKTLGSSSTSTNFDYWNKRLQGIQNPLAPASGGSTFPSVGTGLNPLRSSTTEFVFYNSPVFWIALIAFPALGLGGAWLANFGLEWILQQFSLAEAYSQLSTFWLYTAGVVWGLAYLIYGTIEASDYGSWEDLITTPFISYMAIFDDGEIMKGFFTALPFNLFFSWGISFVGLHFTLGVSSLGIIIALGVITLIQILITFDLDY